MFKSLEWKVYQDMWQDLLAKGAGPETLPLVYGANSPIRDSETAFHIALSSATHSGKSCHDFSISKTFIENAGLLELLSSAGVIGQLDSVAEVYNYMYIYLK